MNYDPHEFTAYISSVKEIDPNFMDATILEAAKLFLQHFERDYQQIVCAERIKFKETEYRKGEFIFFEQEDFAGKIEGILLTKESTIILYKEINIHYIENLRCYELGYENNLIFFIFVENIKYSPASPQKIYNNLYIKRIQKYI